MADDRQGGGLNEGPFDCRLVSSGGALTREQFLLPETRIIARLRLDDSLGDGEIVSRVCAENLFQYPTSRMLANRARVCLRRLDTLADDALVWLVAHGTPDQMRQANLYAMMRSYRLMWDFMVGVVGEHYRTLDLRLTRADITRFIGQWCASDEKASRWAESTRRRIGGTLLNALMTCGYLDSPRGGELRPVLIDGEVEQGILRNCDGAVLVAFASAAAGVAR